MAVIPGEPTIGLRERKKLRTHGELSRAALRLFAEHGYDGTTVAEIATAAEVSVKTFFSYFPSKADVLFADPHERVEDALAAIRDAPPAAPPLQTLRRGLAALLATSRDPDPGIGTLRQRLIATVPEIRTRALFHTLAAQSQIADAICVRHPGLERPAVTASIGAAVGAMLAAVHDAAERGLPPEDMRAAARRANEVALAATAAALGGESS